MSCDTVVAAAQLAACVVTYYCRSAPLTSTSWIVLSLVPPQGFGSLSCNKTTSWTGPPRHPCNIAQLYVMDFWFSQEVWNIFEQNPQEAKNPSIALALQVTKRFYFAKNPDSPISHA